MNEEFAFNCCEHCGCLPAMRTGHDDTCARGCNDGEGYNLMVNYADIRQSLALILLDTLGSDTMSKHIITALDDAVANNCGED